jgi:hypothetical protein
MDGQKRSVYKSEAEKAVMEGRLEWMVYEPWVLVKLEKKKKEDVNFSSG